MMWAVKVRSRPSGWRTSKPLRRELRGAGQGTGFLWAAWQEQAAPCRSQIAIAPRNCGKSRPARLRPPRDRSRAHHYQTPSSSPTGPQNAHRVGQTTPTDTNRLLDGKRVLRPRNSGATFMAAENQKRRVRKGAAQLGALRAGQNIKGRSSSVYQRKRQRAGRWAAGLDVETGWARMRPARLRKLIGIQTDHHRGEKKKKEMGHRGGCGTSEGTLASCATNGQ